jgi:hypothetical protein
LFGGRFDLFYEYIAINFQKRYGYSFVSEDRFIIEADSFLGYTAM